MPFPLSERSAFVVRSEIRNMSLECDRVGGINLSQGVCDTLVPAPVREAAESAIEEGWNTYTAHTGVAAIRDAIAQKLERFSGLTVNPDTELVVTAGSTGAFYSACMALLNPGDEVLLFEPFYGYHLSTLNATGLTARYVKLEPPDWSFRVEDVVRACTPRTRAMMICTPANPCGKIFTAEELALLGQVAVERNLIIFTDEIYEHFTYDGRKHICPATVPGLRERTVLISGLSKTFSITGWRIGFAAAAAKWSEAIGYFSDLIYVCAPAPLQVGVARGLARLEPEFFEGLSIKYQAKRDRICNSLVAAGLMPYAPAGAYYVLANTENLPGSSPKDKAMFLLEKAGVACVPGDSFFHDHAGDNLARFCFAKDDAILDEACLRLEQFGAKHLCAAAVCGA